MGYSKGSGSYLDKSSRKAARDERRYNESSSAAAAANRRNLRNSNAKAARDESRFNSTFGSNAHNHRDDRVAKASRDEARFNANFGNDSSARAKRAYNKADMVGRDLEGKARNLVGNASAGSNPTASGSGRGGKMDREWENHKWVSRKRNEDGKWIYDYGGSGAGTHDKDYYKDDNQYGIGVHDSAKRMRDARGPLEKYVGTSSVGNNNPTAGGSGSVNFKQASQKGKDTLGSWLANGLANTPFSKIFK